MNEKQVKILALATLLTVYETVDFTSPETVEEQIRDLITELEMELVQ